MKDLIRKLLRENSEPLRYEISHLNSHNGQDDYELGLYTKEGIIGMVEYTLFEGELLVNDIVVRPEFRRRGYGSRMMSHLKKEYPDHQYKPSMKTDLGAKFKHKEITESVDLEIMKNMESAQNHGSMFGQDVEPAGTYVSHDDRKDKTPIPNYKLGKVAFNNPLIIDINDDTMIAYKKELSAQFKAKGKTLTKKLMAKGYDGLITRWANGSFQEIVIFPNARYMLS